MRTSAGDRRAGWYAPDILNSGSIENPAKCDLGSYNHGRSRQIFAVPLEVPDPDQTAEETVPDLPVVAIDDASVAFGHRTIWTDANFNLDAGECRRTSRAGSSPRFSGPFTPPVVVIRRTSEGGEPRTDRPGAPRCGSEKVYDAPNRPRQLSGYPPGSRPSC
jgi:hypothetical protein